MAETQTITYGKPAYIEKAQQDLLNALNQYITDIPGLPEKQATGLSDTQKFAIEQLKKALSETTLYGIETNKDYVREILNTEVFKNITVDRCLVII